MNERNYTVPPIRYTRGFQDGYETRIATTGETTLATVAKHPNKGAAITDCQYPELLGFYSSMNEAKSALWKKLQTIAKAEAANAATV